MWSLDDPGVHEPYCKHCYQCQWCMQANEEKCEVSEDGKHEFVWSSGG